MTVESFHAGRAKEKTLRLFVLAIALATVTGCTVPNGAPYSPELITGSIAPAGPFADIAPTVEPDNLPDE
ncbi:hypothetical protein R2A130_1842 [Ahrensia sp. R2A130]|nr:hypothetical protein R2A130_1842 [Ahrensia sp. R2A130]